MSLKTGITSGTPAKIAFGAGVFFQGVTYNEKVAPTEEAVKAAKTELETNDMDKMKAATEKLSNEVQPIFSKLYQQAQAENANNNNNNGSADNGDTEFHQN